jgi:hypothetical protein
MMTCLLLLGGFTAGMVATLTGIAVTWVVCMHLARIADEAAAGRPGQRRSAAQGPRSRVDGPPITAWSPPAGPVNSNYYDPLH